MNIRKIEQTDITWVAQVFTNLWGSTRMISRGKLVELESLEGFIAEERKDFGENPRSKEEGRKVGLITYVVTGQECEIMSINSLTPGKGIGSQLLVAVEQIAKEKGCKKLVVITTNDNTKAVEFYKKNGFTIAVVRKNIMDEYRKLKPEIPLTGVDGISITDEIELQKEI